MGCRDQLDATLLQLSAEGGDFLVLELVLVDVGLEGLLLELADLLSLVEEGAGFQFSKLGQFCSTPSTSAKDGRLDGAAPTRTLCARPVFLLQQDLP